MSLSDLCRHCGLCCDGNLFSHVPLQHAEVAAARRNGLAVMSLVGDSPALRQCCPALKERQCSVYAERPERCRRYGCRLFEALAKGALTLEAALAVVARAHALLADVERSLAPDPDPLASVMDRARFSDWGGLEESSAQTRAARERAEAFLDQHFHGGPRRFEDPGNPGRG